MSALLAAGGPGCFASVDVEVLAPEPGSLDYLTLLSPEIAKVRAAELGLRLPSETTRESIAAGWRGKDVIDREQAMADYIEAVMPGLTMADLVAARATIRDRASDLGITIGVS